MIAVLLALLQSTVAPPPPVAPWAPVMRADPAGGPGSVSAFVMTADRSARLVVRCDRVAEPVVSIQMRTRAGIAAAPDHPVSVVIDGGAPIVTPWEFPGSATMNRGTAAVTQLTVAMNGAKTISVSTTDGETPVMLTFDGPNGGGGIKDVLAACGYEFGVVPKPIKAAKQ